MNKMALGQRIKTIRIKQNITSEKLSEMCDVTPVYIRQIESGSRLPSLTLLVNICKSLCISPDFLLKADLGVNEIDYIQDLSHKIKDLSPKQLKKLNDIIEIIFE